MCALRSLLLALILVVLVPVLAIAAPVPNLLTNASFAAGLAGWSWMEGQGGTPLPTATIDHSVFRGADMAALTVRAEAGKRGLLLQKGAACDPKTRAYVFRGLTRCRDLGADWIIRVGVVASRGKQIAKWLQNAHLAHGPTMDWTPFRIELTVPAEYDQLGVFVGLWYREELVATPPAGGGQVWFEDLALEPVLGIAAAPATRPAPTGVVVDGLYPTGEKGLYTPGQPVQVVLLGHNYDAAPATISLALKVKDYYEQALTEKTVSLELPAQKDFALPVDLPAPERLGFFCVSGLVTREGALLAPADTSFCVVKPAARKDPYFVADVNGVEADLVPAMQLIGVAGRKIGETMHGVTREPGGKLLDYWRETLANGRQAPYWKSSLNLIGNIFLGGEFAPRWLSEQIAERRRLGLFPYPDEAFTLFGDWVEAQATAMKGRTKLWVLSEEIDGTVGIPDLKSGSQHAELMRYVLMSRLAYERLKRVDPENVVIGLAVSSDFNATPPYPLVRRLLPDLRDYVDVLGPDLYTDSWNWLREVSRGPESGEMRRKLLDTLALQRSLGKPARTCIAERGYGLPYHLAPDSPLETLYAQLTARSLILGKSVPEVMFYALHMMCSSTGLRVRDGATSTDDKPLLDLAMWKSHWDRAGKVWHRPRSAVAAYATLTRLLGGSTACLEVLPQTGLYSYVFTVPDGAVAALWTTDPKPCQLQLKLPAGLVLTDLMDNSRSLSAGAVTIDLSGSPCFVSGRVAPAALADLLRQATVPGRLPVRAEARLAALDTLAVEIINESPQPQPVGLQIDRVAGALAASKTLQSTVPASGRSVLTVALQQVDPAKLGKLEGRLSAAGQTVPLSADLSATVVPRAPARVQVDGDLTEWSGATPLVLEGPQWLLPTRAAMERGEWSGPADLSARVYLAWDAGHFYLAARVRDDVHVQQHSGETIWMNDCLQFALDTRNDALSPEITGHSGYDANDYNFALALTPAGPETYCFVERGDTVSAGPRNYPLAIKRGNGETCYELAIPWEALRPLAPRAGSALAGSFVIFDVDGPDEKQASYWLGLTPGIANGQDPSCYRTLVLGP